MKTSTFTKLTAGIALSLVTSSMLHATNGDTLIAVGAKARGMGGVGIAMSHGAESTLTNPALITTVEGTEISFGGTIFMPDITTTLNSSGFIPPQNALTSDADMNMIPEVSLAHKLNDNWYIGIGMWGTAGMGTDYSKAVNAPFTQGQYGNFNMVTNLQLMQFAVPVAYKADGLSIAVAPILQYGNLDMNFKMPSQSTPGQIDNVGAGLAQDFGFGWSAGLSYDFSNGLVLGAVYKSSIEMDYDGQIANAASRFGLGAIGDTLEQPAEYGVGLSYAMGQHTIAFDYKRIKWSSAKGYEFVQWDDQDVIAVGYQYTQDNWALRFGYNYASSAVVEQNGAAPMSQAWMANSAINFFNLLGFPATQESHVTVGGTYTFTEHFSLDLAYVHGLDNTLTFETPAYAGDPMANQGMGVASVTTEHSEDSLSFQLTYKF
ncbi:MAG: outer membrane protein transport protein [Sulfurovum sp.]|nr:outer membrane protein transport protein [Sulfurovum sp.]